MGAEDSQLRAILVIDHGSRRDEANHQLACMARLVQYLAPPDTIVRYAHMELAPPTIAQGFAECVSAGAATVIVVPYMLAPGRHAQDDIPRLVDKAAESFPGIPYHVTAPLGVDPLLGALVLKRCSMPSGELPSSDVHPCTLDADSCGNPWCPPANT